MPETGDDAHVSMLNVGWLTSAKGIWRRDESFDELIRFPIPAYLIEIGEERILVDTGLHPDAARDAQAHYETKALDRFALEQEASIADQLDLRSLTMVILTHLHFDHAGGLALLPVDLPVVLQRREWEAGHDDEAVKRNFYLPRDYAHIAEQVVLVDGDHELLGDGSIQLLLTPGHTPGHQSIRIGSRLVLGGDVTHFASGLDDHRFPMFADDHDAQATSAARLKALRDAGASVLPGHDPAVLRAGPVLSCNHLRVRTMPGPLSNAHTVTKLPAQDLERARAFYRDKLGLEPIEERTGGLRYVCGPTEFHLFSSEGVPSGKSTQMAFEVEDLETTLADLRARGVTFERFEMSGFDVSGDTIAATDNYPSKGTGEVGTFFYDSEGNLIGIGQPVGEGTTRD